MKDVIYMFNILEEGTFMTQIKGTKDIFPQ